MPDMNRWRGRIALVTGASSGIGEEIARRLAGQGLRVALAARRRDKLEELKAELEVQGAQALAIPCDLRREESVLALFDTLRAAWGGPDILINDAGVGWEGALAEGRTEDWREMLDVNVLAMALCMREAVKAMRGKPEALVINLGSSTAHRVPSGLRMVFYSATKHAVRAMTDGLRDELMLEGSPIKVGMISPGLTRSGFHERFFRAAGRAEEHYARFPPLSPADVAETVLFVLSAPRHVLFDDVIFRSLSQTF
jgi:NADP-dependent 3-hydroxy acid dehydrogenase YdfG